MQSPSVLVEVSQQHQNTLAGQKQESGGIGNVSAASAAHERHQVKNYPQRLGGEGGGGHVRLHQLCEKRLRSGLMVMGLGF